MKGDPNKQDINRRNFVGQSIKIVALGSLLSSLGQSCKNKKTQTGTAGADTTLKKTSARGSKKSRRKWNRNALVLNTKTNILHFPTAVIYTYYDEIKSDRIQELSRGAWNPRAENAPRINREQSGIVLEILALQELGTGVNDSNLAFAAKTLSFAFIPEYEQFNLLNFRLHELMLQLVTLNSSIPAEEKWRTFNDWVKKPPQLRKRQKWMETESSFTQRVNYITDRKNEYVVRLEKRASKFAFT